MSISHKTFPFEIVDFNPVTNANWLKDFKGQISGYVQVGTTKYCLPKGSETLAEKYYNMQLRPDDVIITGFARSGTTVTEELAWLLGNNLNYEAVYKTDHDMRIPILEREMFYHSPDLIHEKVHDDQISVFEEFKMSAWEILHKTSDRRYFKTHLPLELLPPNLLGEERKVIYMARNPKDVAVSFYHLNKYYKILNYIGDFPTFWKYFKNGSTLGTPYWPHLQQGWEKRHNKHVCFLFYEDLNNNFMGAIKTIAKFMEVEYSEDQYKTLENFLKIDNFRKIMDKNEKLKCELGIVNVKEPGRVRGGKTGGWKEYFTDDLNTEADEWIEENLKKINIKFPQ